MHFSGCLCQCKVRACLLQCVWKKSVMWAHCSCPSGEHDPAVTCQNAKGLIDRPVLNCVLELISTVRRRYKGCGCPQSLFFSVVLLILSTRHSTQRPCGNVNMEWWRIFSKALKSLGCPRTDRADLILCTCTYKPFRSVEQTHTCVRIMHEVHVLIDTRTHKVHQSQSQHGRFLQTNSNSSLNHSTVLRAQHQSSPPTPILTSVTSNSHVELWVQKNLSSFAVKRAYVELRDTETYFVFCLYLSTKG